MGKLTNKVAIVTGAARGQGEAIARLFIEEGAKVVLGDILDEDGRALVRSLGDASAYVHLDVTSEADWKTAVDAASQFGALNVLINNAGIDHFVSIVDTTLEDYLRVIRVNQVGTFLGIREVIEPMKKSNGGSIVNTSSTAGLQGQNGHIAYVASKWAVRGMTKAAALELGRYGIRVNSIHPGGIDTPMANPLGLKRADMDAAFKDFPIARIGEPLEIARLAVFLASEDSSYSTGGEFTADGGMTAGVTLEALPTS